jgi:hypothetical protein
MELSASSTRKGKDDWYSLAPWTEQKSVPRKVSVTLAEIFGHMRSSLDHLMCAVCIKASGNVDAPAGTQFPIFEDRSVYRALDKAGNPKKGSGRWQMRGAPARIQAIIQGLQPYKRGANAAVDPLWTIHNFANIDKHRKPHLTGAILEGGSIGIKRMHGVNLLTQWGAVGAFEKGTQVGRIEFTVTNPANYVVEMDADFTYGVAFDPKGPGRGELVVPMVQGLIAHVRDVVVPKLEPFV